MNHLNNAIDKTPPNTRTPKREGTCKDEDDFS